MSIYQDWTPVDIGHKKSPKNNQQNSNKKKVSNVECEDGLPPVVLYWPIELIRSLQLLRQAKQISQKDLAKKLNLPSSIINDIEANKIPYNPKLYKTIYRALGGNPSELNFPKEK